jgi:hypothetical protein
MSTRQYLPLLLLLGIITACTQLPAAPTIGATNVSPGLINTNTPTPITVTSVITDPALIESSVNVLRLNSNGLATVIAQLHDDGTNGDAIAGDKTYSARISFNEPAETTLRLQVSAAFRGTLQRSTSPTMTVFVTLPGLPPDPGEAGKATLEGIDYDHDGMRDDVQRYIALTYPYSARLRAALTQVAKANLAAIRDANSKELSIQHGQEDIDAAYCLWYTNNEDTAPIAQLGNASRQQMRAIEAVVLNTPERFTADAHYEQQIGARIYPGKGHGCNSDALSKRNHHNSSRCPGVAVDGHCSPEGASSAALAAPRWACGAGPRAHAQIAGLLACTGLFLRAGRAGCPGRS